MLHHLFSLTLVAALLSSVLSQAVNQPTSVNLRIEGSTKTIFEGTVVTTGHDVTTASGGTHPCNGTNNDANPTPGPTCISALDDAAKLNKFTFNGYVSYFLISHCGEWLTHGTKRYSNFFTQFDDFFITSISGEAQTSTEFWGIFLNYKLVHGGCQQEVTVDDEILFAFDANNKGQLLKLTGPSNVFVGHPIVLTVTDASSGSAVAGAEVDGQTSDANGHVSLTFTKPGRKEVKAKKSDSIRSSQFTIQVTQ
jgi:hypothetical protein